MLGTRFGAVGALLAFLLVAGAASNGEVAANLCKALALGLHREARVRDAFRGCSWGSATRSPSWRFLREEGSQRR
jgi:hypothetical protein